VIWMVALLIGALSTKRWGAIICKTYKKLNRYIIFNINFYILYVSLCIAQGRGGEGGQSREEAAEGDEEGAALPPQQVF
jgi:hypothetical protein